MAVTNRLSEFLNRKKWILPFLFGLMCVFLVASIVVVEVRRFDEIPSNFAFSIGGEICAMMVAIMLTLSILPAYKRQSGYVRIFVTLLTIGSFSLFLDTLQMVIDGLPNFVMLNKIVCVLVFANESFFFFFVWLFVTYALKSKGKTIVALNSIASLLVVVFFLLPFLNFFFPLYFKIPDTGIYERIASTWWLSRVYFALVIILVVIAIFLSNETKKSKIIIGVFITLPLLSVGSGGYQYGVSLLYTSMMVSLVLIYASLYSDNERNLYSTNKELGLATNIQKHMLPSIFPAFPERSEFDIYALMDPAKEVGGDFYDFFLIDDSHLGIVMADVSDKGVPAALFMMASKIMVQNYAMMGFTPKEVLDRVNKQTCANNQDEMFVTIWFGVLDLKTGIITASNGGHEKPIIKKPNGDFEILDDKHNLVVGFFPETVYSEYTIKLEEGSKLFIYTDGVPEASDIRRHQFGMKKTLEHLNKYKDLPVDKICKNMLKDVDDYMDTATQFDDITMLCLEYRGPYDHARHMTLEAKNENVPVIIAPILSLLRELKANPKTIYNVELALEELLVNVASYAYDGVDGNIYIDYEYNKTSDMISITISDDGKAFNPLESEDPDITLPSEKREIGGLGLFLVKKTMDEIKYDRRNNKNILNIKKKIER